MRLLRNTYTSAWSHGQALGCRSCTEPSKALCARLSRRRYCRSDPGRPQRLVRFTTSSRYFPKTISFTIRCTISSCPLETCPSAVVNFWCHCRKRDLSPLTQRDPVVVWPSVFLEAWGTKAKKPHVSRNILFFWPCRRRRQGQQTSITKNWIFWPWYPRPPKNHLANTNITGSL